MGLKDKAGLIRERGILSQALIRHIRARGTVKAKRTAKRFKASKRDFKKTIKKLEDQGQIKVVKRFLRPPKISATDKLISRCLFGINKENLLELMEQEGSISVFEAAEKLETTSTQIEEWSHILEREELLKINKKGVIIGNKPRILRQRIKEKISEKSREKRIIFTQVDYLIEALSRSKYLSLADAAIVSNTEPKKIEKWARTLDILKLDYPSNLLKEPMMTLAKPVSLDDPDTNITGKTLDSYKIVADKVVAHVKIIASDQKAKPIYEVTLPIIGVGTRSLITSLRDALSGKIEVGVGDMSDTKKMRELKETFFTEAKDLIDSEIRLDEDDLNMLAGMMTHSMYGLGDMELLMTDDWLEEVCINTSHIPLTAYHKRFGWVETTLHLDDERMVYNYAAQIGRKVERDITNMDPIMDAHLLSGDRVNATLFPISNFGNTITIRKFARQPWTIAHFVSPDICTMSPEMGAFLWLAFQYELNVIVGGGTASGKTSMLNCLCSLIQPTHRVITIEDTREINLPSYLKWNWVPLTTREANPEGKGEVSMLDLIVTSLRMRPDRIVLGEIRRRREAEVLFEAMHTGHSVYGTIHADTVHNLKRRLLEPPIALPSAEIEALHLMIVVYRDRKKGARKVFEIAEIRPGSEGKEFELNYLFRYNTRTDEFVKVNDSVRVLEDLSLHTGMSRPEILKDLEEKKKTLIWMYENNNRSLEEVGEVMELYYKNKEQLKEVIEGKITIEEIKERDPKKHRIIEPPKIAQQTEEKTPLEEEKIEELDKQTADIEQKPELLPQDVTEPQPLAAEEIDPGSSITEETQTTPEQTGPEALEPESQIVQEIPDKKLEVTETQEPETSKEEVEPYKKVFDGPKDPRFDDPFAEKMSPTMKAMMGSSEQEKEPVKKPEPTTEKSIQEETKKEIQEPVEEDTKLQDKTKLDKIFDDKMSPTMKAMIGQDEVEEQTDQIIKPEPEIPEEKEEPFQDDPMSTRAKSLFDTMPEEPEDPQITIQEEEKKPDLQPSPFAIADEDTIKPEEILEHAIEEEKTSAEDSKEDKPVSDTEIPLKPEEKKDSALNKLFAKRMSPTIKSMLGLGKKKKE